MSRSDLKKTNHRVEFYVLVPIPNSRPLHSVTWWTKVLHIAQPPS